MFARLKCIGLFVACPLPVYNCFEILDSLSVGGLQSLHILNDLILNFQAVHSRNKQMVNEFFKL
jgi:amino acid permease